MAYKMKGIKSFNFTGDKGSTTPGYKTTKIAKKAANKVSTKAASFGSKTLKNFQNSVISSSDKTTSLGRKNTVGSEIKRGAKSFSEAAKGKMKNIKVPSGSSKIVKALSQAGKVARVASKMTGAGAVLELGYRAYKSGQKNSGGKAVKGQKTNALGMRKSIFKK